MITRSVPRYREDVRVDLSKQWAGMALRRTPTENLLGGVAGTRFRSTTFGSAYPPLPISETASQLAVQTLVAKTESQISIGTALEEGTDGLLLQWARVILPLSKPPRGLREPPVRYCTVSTKSSSQPQRNRLIFDSYHVIAAKSLAESEQASRPSCTQFHLTKNSSLTIMKQRRLRLHRVHCGAATSVKLDAAQADVMMHRTSRSCSDQGVFLRTPSCCD